MSTFLFWISIALMVINLCTFEKGEAMSTTSHFKTAKDLQSVADSESGLPDDTGGIGLLLPKKLPQQLAVTLFFYRTSIGGGKYKMFPPHHIMELDPATGAVIQFRASAPRDFGISQSPNEPIYVIDFKPKPDPNAKDFFAKAKRFDEISPAIWELYDTGENIIDPDKKAIIKEYRALFNEIAKRPLIPYYTALTPGFFKWLEAASK
ncbi:MAG TPA: hypothetical protein VLX12_05090 [Syntrophorhabdales bacterium]|nr:hypothetical protein [Syntrophorhabdales bacterium]